MKTLFTLFLFLCTAIANADTGTSPVDDASRPPPDPSKIRFVPPPLPAPAPAMRVQASTLSDFGTHQIEILLGTASDLPDIPPPPVASPPSADRKPRTFKPKYLLHITMTVYDKQISHLKWQDPVSKEKFEAWCQ